MNSQECRIDRQAHQMRPIRITCDPFGYAASSVLFELGNTKVLCAVNLVQGVPPFLRGKKTGWMNAEYALLPASTPTRSAREITQMKRSGRSMEISRLIGRALRTIVNLDSIGEQTIIIDCDVLQADGGTRTASITATWLALAIAQDRWLEKGSIHTPFLLDTLAAVSVGVLGGQVIVDPDYAQDSVMEADFNIIMTASGKLVEMQGGAEKSPITWDTFDVIRSHAQCAISELMTVIIAKRLAVNVIDQERGCLVPVSSTSSSGSVRNRLNP